MRFLMATVAAATIGAASLAIPPASAQVGIQVEVPGVGVRVGEPDRRERERVREHEVVEPHGDVNGSCRTKMERVERPDGSAYERQVRVCD